jgi:hypothetical protein
MAREDRWQQPMTATAPADVHLLLICGSTRTGSSNALVLTAMQDLHHPGVLSTGMTGSPSCRRNGEAHLDPDQQPTLHRALSAVRASVVERQDPTAFAE